jgi:hypothetical protein
MPIQHTNVGERSTFAKREQKKSNRGEGEKSEVHKGHKEHSNLANV